MDFEVSPSAAVNLIALGTCAGVTVSSYLASCGYFNEALHSPALFGLQNIVVYSANFLVILLQWAFDEYADRRFGVYWSYATRVIAAGLLASLFQLLVPVCKQAAAVLAVGAAISFTANAMLSSSMQLSAAGMKGGSMLVSLGATLGGAMPLLMSHITGFWPESNLENVWLFYSVSCLLGIICIAMWAAHHGFSSSITLDEEENEGEAATERLRRTPTEEFIATAYNTIENSLQAPQREREIGVRGLCSVPAVSIFVIFLSGFAIVPLFTLEGSHLAQRLYLMKCLGDFIGRIVAIYHSIMMRSKTGKMGTVMVCGVFCLIVGRITLSAVITFDLLGAPSSNTFLSPFTMTILVVIIFSIGGYAALMLDLFAQLRVEESQRVQVQRANLVMMFAGQIVGITIGIAVGFSAAYQQLSSASRA